MLRSTKYVKSQHYVLYMEDSSAKNVQVLKWTFNEGAYVNLA